MKENQNAKPLVVAFGASFLLILLLNWFSGPSGCSFDLTAIDITEQLEESGLEEDADIVLKLSLWEHQGWGNVLNTNSTNSNKASSSVGFFFSDWFLHHFSNIGRCIVFRKQKLLK